MNDTFARTIAPFVKADEGYVICLETASFVFTSAKDEAVIFSCGLPHGSIAEMCAQVDHAFERALTHRDRVCTIIETRHRSFRFPDHGLRRVLQHLRKHEKHMGDIYFLDLPALIRRGLKLFAFPFLDPLLKSKLRMIPASKVSEVLHRAPTRWGGPIGFDKAAYLERRAAAEGSSLADVRARAFDATILRDANAALAEQVCAARRSPRRAAAVLFEGVCRKRGSGGLFGSIEWKRKTVRLTDASMSYSDRSGETTIALDPGCTWSTPADTLVLETAQRSYVFSFEANERARFLASLTAAHGALTDTSST